MPHCKVYLKRIWTNFLVCCFKLSFFYDSRDANSSSERLISIKSKCSLESIPHCKVYLKRFWTNMKHSDLINWRQFVQHFLKSISKILATSDVDHSKFSLPNFKKQLNVVSVPKPWNTQTYLETVLSACRQIARWNFTNSLKTTVLSLL